jgi:hypothetical protein
MDQSRTIGAAQRTGPEYRTIRFRVKIKFKLSKARNWRQPPFSQGSLNDGFVPLLALLCDDLCEA